MAAIIAKRDAGVAAGGLNQNIAGSDRAARFGLLDHAQRRSILDRTRRIVAFQLAENQDMRVRPGRR
jgi:hypothetical protein